MFAMNSIHPVPKPVSPNAVRSQSPIAFTMPEYDTGSTRIATTASA